MSDKFKIFTIFLVFLLVFQNIDCRKGSFGRRKSKGSSSSSSGSSTGTSSSASTGSSWFSWGSSSKTTTAVKPSTTNTKPAETSGWKRVDTNSQTNYGWKKEVTSGTNTGARPGQTYGWTNPSPGQHSNTQTGWANPNYKPDAKATNFQPKPNAPPSSNIGPGGYPVQSGMGYPHNTGLSPNRGYNAGTGGFQTSGHHSPGGYNTGYHPSGYNTGYHPSGYNTGYHPSGYNPQSGFQTPHFGAGSYPSQHGFTSSYYPSHNNFGYPGQGLFGGSKGPKFGGLGIFGGSSGKYGYPGSGNWGYPSYGTGGFGHKSGSGSMLKGLAIGAVGGYLTSSLIHRISNPWGYGGYGYGMGYGYDRGSYWRRDRYEPRVEPTQVPNSGPENNWINCVAIDPTTNTTLINPNCSCTVTTVNDPVTNLPISTHNCTPIYSQNSPGIQPMGGVQGSAINPIGEQQTPGQFNQNGQLYDGTQGYGMYGQPVVDPVLNSTIVSGAENAGPSVTSDSPESQKQTSGGDVDILRRRNEFYSKLEKIVNMGKLLP